MSEILNKPRYASRRARLVPLFILALIVLAGAGLRLWRMGGESVYSDEWASLQHIQAPGLLEFIRLERVSDPPMMPVYFTLEYGWGRLVGGSFYGIRLMSVLFGLATIPLLFYLARMLYGPLAGCVAAGCLALSVGHIYFSQEVRPYSFILFLAVLSNIALWKSLDGGQKRWWALNYAANAVLLFTHLFTILFVFSQAVYLFLGALHSRRPRRFFLWCAAHLPLAVPYALWFASINREELEVAAVWRHGIVHSFLQPLGDLLLFVGAGVPTFRDLPFAGTLNIGAVAWRFFGLILLLCVALTLYRWRKKDSAAVKSFVFLATLLAVPSVTLFLVSALFYACHSCRYVIYGTLPLLALVGGTVAMLPGRKLRIVAAGALLCFYGVNLYAHPKPWRPDIRAAAAFLDSRFDGRNGAMLVCHGGDAPTIPFNGHARLAALDTKAAPDIARLREIIPPRNSAAAPLWLVVFLHQLQPPALLPLENDLHAKGWQFSRKMFGYTNPIYVYELAPGPPLATR